VSCPACLPEVPRTRGNEGFDELATEESVRLQTRADRQIDVRVGSRPSVPGGRGDGELFSPTSKLLEPEGRSTLRASRSAVS
jgi:hypothetical protein